MKIYYDMEFLEGTQSKRFLGIKYGETKPTIDIISIGMVAEDGRELYLISKDFNLREAWNRYDLKDVKIGETTHSNQKVYWIRDNVLIPIFNDLNKIYKANDGWSDFFFSYKNLKYLLELHGKSNEEIKEAVMAFANPPSGEDSLNHSSWNNHLNKYNVVASENRPVELYGYYSAYDHVSLSWLFGKMINLPTGFPMYTRDLQQMLEEKIEKKIISNPYSIHYGKQLHSMVKFIKNNSGVAMKTYPEFPKNGGAHNALEDARFNKELHQYIINFLDPQVSNEDDKGPANGAKWLMDRTTEIVYQTAEETEEHAGQVMAEFLTSLLVGNVDLWWEAFMKDKEPMHIKPKENETLHQS